MRALDFPKMPFMELLIDCENIPILGTVKLRTHGRIFR